MAKKGLTNIADINYEKSVEEFKRVLSGFDSDISNLEKNKVAGLDFSIGNTIKNSLSTTDTKILNRLIGTISSGFYLRDMISGKAFETSIIGSAIRDKIEDIVSGDKTSSKYYFYHADGKKLVNRLNPSIKNTVKNNNFNDLFNIGIESENYRQEPSIGAVELKTHTLSLNKRYGDALSLFFNCIPSIDMSMCAPYLDVKVLVPEREGNSQALDRGVEFRFEQYDKESGFISKSMKKIKENIKEAVNNSESKEKKYKQYGMELFTSPQTLTNSNIRKIDKNILEPNATLLTLKNCTVTIAGMGVGLYCSKNARMNLVLHDRSRLKDIEPLISPKQFGKSRIILEYGWHHPQGGPTSNNVVGKFLNSLRDKGVFIVKGSSFNFSDGGHVNITIDMAMVGSKSIATTSIATGNYVQASVFKDEIEDVIKKLREEEIPQRNSATEARKTQKITVSSATGAKTIMHRNDYNIIKKLIDQGDKKNLEDALNNFIDSLDSQEKTIEDAITEKIESLPLNGTDPSSKIKEHFLLDNPSILNTESAGSFTSLGSVIMLFVAYPMYATYQFDEVQVFFYPMNQSSAGGHVHTTASFPIDIEELKKVLTSDDEDDPKIKNMSIQTFMRRLDRKIMRNPAYKHYGLNSEYSQLNAIKDLTEENIFDILAGTDDNVNKVLQDLVNQSSIAVEQVKKQQSLNEFNSLADDFSTGIKEKAAQSNSRFAEALINQDVEVNQRSFEEIDAKEIKNQLKKIVKDKLDSQLKTIYSTYTSEFKERYPNEYSDENKFCIPNLSYYLETVNPKDSEPTSFKDYKDKFKNENNLINDEKTILRIHVYDEEAIGNKMQDLLLNICNSQVVVDAISENKLKLLENLRNKNSKKSNIFGSDKDSELTKKIGNSIVSNLDFNEVKDIIKQSMPSITIGSNLSNVKSFNASSTTSNDIANVIFLTEQTNPENNNQTGYNSVLALDNMNDMTVIPSVGSISCPGMPLIQRGQEIFIDANTGTTIDSIYVVQSVSHNIGEGGFNTSVNLMYTGQNRIESIREKVISVLPK